MAIINRDFFCLTISYYIMLYYLFIVDFPLSSIVSFRKRTIGFSTLYLNTLPSILFLNNISFICCFILHCTLKTLGLRLFF